MHEATRFPRPFGKYMLVRQIAVGGMAEVYLARQSGPAGFEKECVIKRILPSLAADRQFVQMFLEEARLAARLAHPNIVQVFDLGEVGPQDYYLAMEYIHGTDLQHVLEAEAARKGRVPMAVALRLASNIAEGLDHAHRATDGRGGPLGLVHRDVTPSNVMVSFDGVAKILDFGIAKAVAQSGKTEVGVIKGKVPYMSPEQVQGEALDGRSDVFSLGTVLYELTVGHKPFDGANAAEISLKILHDEPPLPEAAGGAFSEPLSAIIRRALAKKRDERFASARELQVALDELLVASGIRCTSHEVAAYLEELLPGRRARPPEDVPAATDPTMPMRAPSVGPMLLGERRDAEAPEPVIGDISLTGMAPVTVEGARRNLGGGSGATKWIVLALVLAVAAAFWYLRGRAGEASQTAPPVEKAGEAPKPAPGPEAAAPKPAPAEVAGQPAPEAAAPKPAPAEVAAQPAPPEAEAQPAPPEPAAQPAPAPKPPAKKKPAPRPKPRPKAEEPRELPRLPEPPPPDDAP